MKFYEEEWFIVLVLAWMFFCTGLAGATSMRSWTAWTFLGLGAGFSAYFAVMAYRFFQLRHADRFIRGE